ncbi:UDP-GalNAc:beta-1,3-N-acetylgalactosaminyltransferase 2-like [Scleropages formosus]|uniref:Hexosyltransferase n=1 Tax=Scleropages formosus TaxID=113540 RepID=A0A0P7UZZ0_SCLFO|nr:UDP-GalNAc:beta-1,3-N-acetylgalactosaminyltransferase 2-like [Scleropages formosus]
MYTDGRAPAREVLVGVLSARQHRALRDAIRETVLVKFIIGKHGCAVPEEDREDPYSCALLNLTEPGTEAPPPLPPPRTGGYDAPVSRLHDPKPAEDSRDVEVLAVPHASVLGPSDVSVVSLDFKVLHPVVITRLGVFPHGPHQELCGNVTVKLFQLDQEEAVVTARFSAISTGTKVNGLWYKPVEQFILPRGFEGSLVWESLDSTSLTTADISKVQLNAGGGVVRFASVEEGTLPHRSARGFPGLAGGFTFSIYDAEALSEMLRGRPARRDRHAARLREEGAELERESRRHGDMVFVDVTDDDCYIDVDAVLMKIDQKGLKRSNFWWGNFRQSWAVDRVGKWQELEYASPAYPAFACGSGYVVSRDLVQWLADNADKLKAYQGEDVSMGIWMAADCYADMLSSPQHSVQELRTLWAGRRACGDPCGCPGDRR